MSTTILTTTNENDNQIEHDAVFKVWNICVNVYRNNGIKLSFPKSTLYTNTYQWRYAKKIASKLAEFDDRAICSIIDLAVKDAKASGQLRKGLAAILVGDLLKRYSAGIDKLAMKIDKDYTDICKIHQWLVNKAGANRIYDVLLLRNNPISYCNLTLWYQAMHVTSLYISLSKSCLSILGRLDQLERSLFPSLIDLFVIKDSFLSDSNNLVRVKTLFGSEWSDTCLL